MRVSDAIFHSHMKTYVSAVMAELLRAHGFINKSENMSHWYRIKGDLVQAVFIGTDGCYLPSLADIYYCCHPLFVMPVLPPKTRRSGVQRSIHALTPYRMLSKIDVTTAPYAPNAMIMCPCDEYHGADIAEEAIAILNNIATVEQCYQKRLADFENTSRLTNIPLEELWVSMFSPEIMNEIVFLDDRKMYPYCAESIQQGLDRFQMWEGKRKLADVELYEFGELKRLKSAIIDGCRSAHLEYLEERSIEYAALLRKKVKGIHSFP